MGWFKDLLFETVVTQVDTATPQDTMVVVERGHARWSAAEHLDYVDNNSHTYAGTTKQGFAIIEEKEHKATGKGAVEALLGLFL